jgi:GR25 family glycosyltransferase involved in LPS biosynthesis
LGFSFSKNQVKKMKNNFNGIWGKLSSDIYCINLKENLKRRKQCKNIFKNYSIPCKFFPAIKNSNGNLGCLLSHRTLYRYGVKKNMKNMLIFEDDISPTSSLTVKNLEEIITFLNISEYDIFFLGVVPDIRTETTEKIWDNIYSVKGICTHAYIISDKGMKKLMDIEYTSKAPLDYLIRDSGFKMYMYYPCLFHQETGYKFPRHMISGFMRGVEWYSVYINIPLKTMGIFLVIFMIFIILKFRGKLNKKI